MYVHARVLYIHVEHMYVQLLEVTRKRNVQEGLL